MTKYRTMYWAAGYMWFVSLGEFGWLAWSTDSDPRLPRCMAHLPRGAA